MTPGEQARAIVRDRMHAVREWCGDVAPHTPRHAKETPCSSSS